MDATTGQAVITVAHHVKYQFDPVGPGGPSHSQTIEGRDPHRQAREAPPGVSAFIYYDIVECVVTVDGQVVHTTSQPRQVTRQYFIRDGEWDVERTGQDRQWASMV